jgi:UDP-3-O-[3-hydroxymyristoyl] N-acetylglucosamine deacetylase
LALVGLPLLARVQAHKAGHALHTQLVTRLLADPSLWKETTEEPSAVAASVPETFQEAADIAPASAAD